MKTALMMQEWWCQQYCLFLFRVLMETDPEEHRLNYERYRTLVMIDYSGGQSISCLLPLSMGHNDVNKQKPGDQLSENLKLASWGLCVNWVWNVCMFKDHVNILNKLKKKFNLHFKQSSLDCWP